MANQNPTNPPDDRRDIKKEGSSLSGSRLRNNTPTEDAIHPERLNRKDDEVVEVVDQDPGERQKENQNQSKDDPLAA